MPRDVNGTYTLPPGTIVATGDTILPSQHNPAMTDIAAALNGIALKTGVTFTGPVVSGAALSVNGKFTVTNESNFFGPVTVFGTLGITEDISMGNNRTIQFGTGGRISGPEMRLVGNFTAENNFTVFGNAGFQADIAMGGTLAFGPSGSINSGSDLQVKCITTFQKGLTVNFSLGVLQNISVGGLVAVAGPVSASTFITTSDRRMKTNITDLDGAAMLAGLRKIGGKRYAKSGVREMGVIAQDVQSAGMSELVVMGEKGMLGVNYASLIAPLIASVVYLADRLKALEDRNEAS